MPRRLKRYQKNLSTVTHFSRSGSGPPLRLRVESFQHRDPAQAVLQNLVLDMKIRNSDGASSHRCRRFGGPLLKREKWRTPWMFLFYV